jgi:glycosyltransferase involved in cell wall biosynthesis
MLMPAFNGGEYIIEAAAGALEQMRDDDELVIQDGGSTDGSIDELRRRFAAYPQLKIMSEPDDGQADALNRALARAANPAIGWLNADDRLYPGALDAVRKAWADDPELDLVYGSWTIFDNDGQTRRLGVPHEYTLRSLMWQPHVFSGAVFYRRDLVRETGGFDREMYMCMDLDLVLRLAALRPRTAQLPDVLAGFRWHDDSKTGVMDFRVVREAFTCRRRNARGLAGRAYAEFCSVVHLIAWLSTPLRQAKWYSRIRVRRISATTGG